MLTLVLFVIWLLPVALMSVGILRLSRPVGNAQPRVSIIVAAHNEESVLARCLQALSGQDYPGERFEIILVDDRSEDATATIIQNFRAANPQYRIRVLTIRETKPGWQPKKFALAKAAALASGEVLLFTDADCRPATGWLRAMAAPFAQAVDAVVGIAPLVSSDANFATRLARYEGLMSAFAAAGGIGLGYPFMATGRNFAVRRKRYMRAAVQQHIRQKVSGDDDLLLQQIPKQNHRNVILQANPESHVPSPAPERLPQWLGQRGRHVSAGGAFRGPEKLGYLCYHAGWGLFAAVGYFLTTHQPVAAAATLAGARVAIELGVLYFFARKIGTTFDSIWFVPCLLLSPVLTLGALVKFWLHGQAWLSIRDLPKIEKQGA